MAISFRDRLNERQWEAVTATEGPVLVIAGAGSGKTRVLTERIAYLVEHERIPPFHILAFTFTNKAAREMKGRLEKSIPGISRKLWVGTFHATGVRILRNHGERIGIPRGFSIYDAQDSLNLVKNIITRHTLSGSVLRSPHSLRDAISRWKNELITPSLAQDRVSNNVEKRIVFIYEEYEKELKRAKAMDFDDLIAKAVELFSVHPDVRDHYAKRFLYVLVDEFQDTNPIQMAFIDALSSAKRNLFVVGDDDQSIYGWRGARVEHILNFENLYAGTRVIRLEQNYRSTKTILDAANSVIAFNKGRKGKNLWTEGESGERVKLISSMDEEEEAANVFQTVASLLQRGLKLRDIAILYRTNAQSRALEEVLKLGSIPYQIIGSVRFYERMEVRDILAYCKLIVNPADVVSLQRIINVPKRALGRATFQTLEEQALRKGLTITELLSSGEYEVGKAKRKRCQSFTKTIEKLRAIASRETAPRVVEEVIEEVGYRAHLKANYPDHDSRIENIEELVSAADAFCETHEDRSLQAFLEEISLVSDVDNLDEEGGQLTLMTLHNAKGLEFGCVIITGLEEGLFPHYSALESPGALEEERRLFYVGMTRAKELLFLSYANMRRRMGFIEGQSPSRFLSEVPKRCLEEQPAGVRLRGNGLPDGEDWVSCRDQEVGGYGAARAGEKGLGVDRAEDRSQDEIVFRVGMRIIHRDYGKGVVSRIEGSGENLRVSVLFDAGDERKFLACYAPIDPL